jgi:hypothetical protein
MDEQKITNLLNKLYEIKSLGIDCKTVDSFIFKCKVLLKLSALRVAGCKSMDSISKCAIIFNCSEENISKIITWYNKQIAND